MFLNLIARFFFVLIGITPFPLLGIWEYSAYFVTRYILKYRKKVVRKNLELAFPKQSDAYYKKLEKQFYHYFVRNFLEMAKTAHISGSTLASLNRFSNVDEINKYLREGKSVILAFGHHNNWVWPMILSEMVNAPVYMVYRQLANKHIDGWLRNNRCAPNVIYVEKKSTARYFLKAAKEQQPSVFMMVADQSPSSDKGIHWVDFMNIKTPFYRGIEFFSTKFNMPVFFTETIGTKKYNYEHTFRLIYDGTEKVKEGIITQRFASALEEAVKKQPENYLWSHKRWKKIIEYE